MLSPPLRCRHARRRCPPASDQHYAILHRGVRRYAHIFPFASSRRRRRRHFRPSPERGSAHMRAKMWGRAACDVGSMSAHQLFDIRRPAAHATRARRACAASTQAYSDQPWMPTICQVVAE